MGAIVTRSPAECDAAVDEIVNESISVDEEDIVEEMGRDRFSPLMTESDRRYGDFQQSSSQYSKQSNGNSRSIIGVMSLSSVGHHQNHHNEHHEQ